MNKIERYLTINPYSRIGKRLNSVSNIVIHWVGNANSSAIANRNYFENLKNKHIYASSQYIIGLNGEAVQCMPENEVAYHAGNLTMNYNSIGIEICHPDWTGKFNDTTYNALIELLTDLCRRYNLTADKIIRHYDVTGKLCPKYYVEHNDEFLEIRNKVAINLNQNIIIKDERGELNMAKIYKNGSTRENVFADTGLTVKTGSLDKHEQCECLDIVDGKYLVKYKVNGTNRYKTGFVAYHGGIR